MARSTPHQADPRLTEHGRRSAAFIASGRLRQRSCEIKEGEERTVYEVVVDGTDASEAWYVWSALASRGHSPLPPAATADRNRRLGRVEALLPHRE